MPHAKFIDDITQTVAKIAECLGATVDSGTEKSMARLEVMVEGTPARLFINQAWNGKATIAIDNANIPAKAWNQYGRAKTPTIGVDLARDPLALAKDIERRLLEPSADALRVNYRRALDYLDSQNAKARFIDDLAREFPDMVRTSDHGDATVSGGACVHVYGTVTGADALHIPHITVRGADTIRAFLRFCQEGAK